MNGAINKHDMERPKRIAFLTLLVVGLLVVDLILPVNVDDVHAASYEYPKEFKPDEQYSLDLDGDGEKESIVLTKIKRTNYYMEECTQYILYVDGKEIIKKEKGVSDSLTFASVDLQGKDKYTEILMQEHGGDYDNTRCYFYRYDEGKLVKAKASYNLPVTPNRFSPRSDKKKKNVAYIQMGCHFDKGFPYVRAYGNGKFAVGILHGKYNQKIKWVKFKLANNFKISQVKSTNKATSNANKDKVSGKAKFVLHYYKGDKDIRYYSIKGKKYAAANKAMKKQAVAAYKEQGME